MSKIMLGCRCGNGHAGGLTKSRPHDRTRPHSPAVRFVVRSCGRNTLITIAER